MRPLLARCHHRNVESAFDTGADLGRHGRVGLPGTLRPCNGGAAGEGAHGMSGTSGGFTSHRHFTRLGIQAFKAAQKVVKLLI